ncbi:tripartite tricarboxylate transporter substrate binding protein [Ramlibacter sp. MAHUQ-53]|uniref:tripartite tricarboxylate transporter substrate binding protein n=1 Tax=unclassified Ramlibacter TaxID=2617605 RepID=UPI00363FCBFC
MTFPAPAGLRRRALLQAAALAAAPAAFAQAPAFPQRPVRIVVPYTPGGSNDVIARLVAQKLQELWPHPVVVDNKPGAAGNLGSAEVVKSAPDGHTLLLNNINITSMNPALIERMPFDASRDFAHISLLGTTSLALAVNPAVPAQTVQELVKLLRARPGRMSYASSGNGSPQHMAMEMFKAMTKTSVVHIPYRGAAPALTDVVGGQIEMTIGVVNQVIPHVRAGRLRALAVTSRKRLPGLPEVPTLDESGVPGYECEIWLGLSAPAGTPAPIVDAINQAVRRVMAQPDVAQRLGGQGIEVLTSTPEQMRQRAADDLKRWTEVIRTAGIRAE